MFGVARSEPREGEPDSLATGPDAVAMGTQSEVGMAFNDVLLEGGGSE